jgi:large subunit ribosomal protein L13
MKTIFPNKKQVERKWYVVDAEGKRLGRVATEIAALLRGKGKPEFTYHQEMGDYVIVVNAEKVVMTGNKMNDKLYHHHSGYPGGLTSETFEKAIKRKPTFPMERAVWGMLPKGSLGRKLFKNLKVYAGPTHPHAAQQPEKIEL